MARADAVTAGGPDVGSVAAADVKRRRRVDVLFCQIFCEQLFALAAAVVAGSVEEIPGQAGTAGAQQPAELTRRPVRIGDESDVVTRAFRVRVLSKHFGIRPAELELGAELGGGEVLQAIAIEPEKPERKAGVDVVDADFRRAGLLPGELARPRLGLDAMLDEIFRSIRVRFGNAGEFVSSFEHTVRRRAGP